MLQATFVVMFSPPRSGRGALLDAHRPRECYAHIKDASTLAFQLLAGGAEQTCSYSYRCFNCPLYSKMSSVFA